VKGKQNIFTVSTPSRVYIMYPDNPAEQEQWISGIQKTVDKLKGVHVPAVTVQPVTKEIVMTPKNKNPNTSPQPVVSSFSNTISPTDVRDKLQAARRVIPFLISEESKVLEFWEIWLQSLPPLPEIENVIVYEISASLDIEKITWRTSGPQHNFIQRMVDFFWNVGAPEAEIDRLNEIGSLINPTAIGSWIDMSRKGGMDGGWFFPVDVPIKFAFGAADSGVPLSQVEQWAKTHNIERCTVVARDMGAAPPRQTEIRFDITGTNISEQLQTAISGWKTFEFPPLPQTVIDLILSDQSHVGLAMSVITSSQHFVKLGIYVPSPSKTLVEKCFVIKGITNRKPLLGLEDSLQSIGPDFVEFHYLRTGYGYEVYTEGFDITFHYRVGEECGADVEY